MRLQPDDDNMFDDIRDEEIRDDEIRIISYDILSEESFGYGPEENDVKSHKPRRPKRKLWVIVAAVIVIVVLLPVFLWREDSGENDEESYYQDMELNIVNDDSYTTNEETIGKNVVLEKGFVETRDTIVNKVPLTIYKPTNLTPRLHLGVDALEDSTASFVVQAADIRRDNGQIVGAFVLDGNLLSRGQSKAGFCAIINGKMNIGVADATPYLEQAIETGGSFFRQYPLVVGGQVVENKLKPSSLRKSLAELNGDIVVITSDKKQTLNEFAQTLVDLGVSNAIYLIGSSAPGFAIDEEGNRINLGKEYVSPAKNSNYIVWK